MGMERTSRMVCVPPQIMRTLQDPEKALVILSLRSYRTRAVPFFIRSYFWLVSTFPMAADMTSVCLKFFVGTRTTLVFPARREKTNEKAKFTGTFDGAI